MSWLNKYLTTKDDYTHLSLKSGKYKIINDIEFLEKYSKAIDRGEKLFLAEKRKNIFKYNIDLDIIDTIEWELKNILDIVKYIQSNIFKFYKLNNNVLICLCNKPKILSQQKIKTGIHLIWPSIFVDSRQALILREAMIQYIDDYKGKIPINNWKDVFDETIYTRNCLRMIGSDKILNNGIPENRVYGLKTIVDTYGNFRPIHYNRLKNNNFDLFYETSIRNTPTDFQLYIPWIETPKNLIIDNSKLPEVTTIKNFIEVDSEQSKLILDFCNTQLPKIYKNTITKIKKYENGNYLLITKSRWCLNIQRNHKSCGIYFIANPKGICQKCYCPCDTTDGRLYGLCKEFTSEYWIFNEKIKSLLFDIDNTDSSTISSYDDKKNLKKLTKKKYKKIPFKNINFNYTNPINFLENYEDFCENLFNSIK